MLDFNRSFTDSNLNEKDMIVLSVDSSSCYFSVPNDDQGGPYGICTGFIYSITPEKVVLSLDSFKFFGFSDNALSEIQNQMLWRIDKDEFSVSGTLKYVCHLNYFVN